MPRHPLRWLHFCFDILASNFGLLRTPFRLFLVVTKNCSSRCAHCKIWSEMPKDELTVDQYEKIAMSVPSLKWLNISGGEPTDREDLELIVAAFVRSCKNLCVVNFTTNGLRPDRIESCARNLLALGIPKVIINVSIDGPEPVNDALRGIPGDFALATETLRRLKGLQGVSTQLSMTLYPSNRSLVLETVAAVRERIGDFSYRDVHLNLPHASGHYYKNSKISALSASSLLGASGASTAAEITRFRKEHGFPRGWLGVFERAYLKRMPAYMASGRTPIKCSALISTVYVSETGELYPCTIWDRNVGSLRENGYDIPSALRTPQALMARQAVKNLECSNCWSPCEAFPSLMASMSKLI